MKKSFPIYIPAFLLIVFATFQATAQQDTTSLQKEVEVVKAYQPNVSDAFKINDIPKIQDEKSEKPSFDYQINSQPVFSTFEVEPVQAAEMVGEPKPELGQGLLKAGFGNYRTSYGEFFYNSVGKNSNFGMHFKHLSSNGTLKLVNKDKVDAPHSENVVELFSKHFFRRSTLNTKLFFNRQAHKYYGYPGEMLSDSAKQSLMPYWNDKQVFSKRGLQLQLDNDEDSRADLNYDLNLYYHYLGTKTNQNENLIKLGTNFRKDFNSFYGLLNASLSYLKTDSIFNETADNYGHKQQILINLSPSILWEGDDASFRAGLNTFTLFDDDADARVLITPNIKAEWSPAANIMTLFAGADGRLQQNHYSAIAAENRFVNPYQDIRNTEYQYILTAGIKGKFSPRFNYRFQADYAGIKDEHFFILKNRSLIDDQQTVPDTINNTFDVSYDDLKQLILGAEFYYTASDLVNFHLKGNYYSYNMDSLENPWHKPDIDLTISMILNPEGPLKFNADVFFVGERKALVRNEIYDPLINSVGPLQLEETIYPLASYVDLNFGVEYQYSPKLGFFGRVNNFAFQKYENWSGYAQQGFNLLVGASYSF